MSPETTIIRQPRKRATALALVLLLALIQGAPGLPPTAEANGAYTGAVGAGLQLSSAGSADPDGA